MSKFCLPMGLYWRLARCLKAALNSRWLEDTCLVLCIFNVLVQLLEHRIQQPPRWGLTFPRVCLGEEWIKVLTVWPSDYHYAKTFFVGGMLTRMIAAFILQLSSCSASTCCEMLCWFNLCAAVRWVLSSLSYGWGNWGPERYAKVTQPRGAWSGMRTLSSSFSSLALLLLWVVCGMWSRPNLIWCVLKKEERSFLGFFSYFFFKKIIFKRLQVVD